MNLFIIVYLKIGRSFPVDRCLQNMLTNEEGAHIRQASPLPWALGDACLNARILHMID